MSEILIMVIGLLGLFTVNVNHVNAQESADGLSKNKQFPVEWYLHLKDPQYCPAAVVDGKLYDKDGKVFCTFDEDNQLMQLKQVPYKASITWLSYTENQFYETTFSLPGDSITLLLKSGSGFEESDKSDIIFDDRVYQLYRYENIYFKFFIGGTVSVKMSSSWRIMEVAQSKAKKIAIPSSYYQFLGKEDKRQPAELINDYYSSKHAINEIAKTFLHKYGAKGLESLYSPQMYTYNIIVKWADENTKRISIRTAFLNDDLQFYPETDVNHLKDVISRGILQNIYISYEPKKNIEILIEREYIARFFGEHLSPGMSFVLHIDEAHRKIEACLTDGTQSFYVPDEKMRYSFCEDYYVKSSNYQSIGSKDDEKYE